MADTVYAPDPWSALAQQHSDIRREGSGERGEIRRDIAAGVSDIRREAAVGFDETRFAVAGTSAEARREVAAGFGESKYAVAVGNDNLSRDVLTSAYNVRQKVDEVGDSILQRSADFFIAAQGRDFDNARDITSIKAATDLSAQKLGADILLAGEKSSSAAILAGERSAGAAALESARLGTAVALGQHELAKEIAQNQYVTNQNILESKYQLSKEIGFEGDKTRALINSLKNDDLNRMLIERNTDLQGCRSDYWGARDGLLNSQFAALSSQVNSQVNAVNSQLAETRQGMVNFGTMRNVGQDSTNNQVR